MKERYYPAYTIGEDAFSNFNSVCMPLGKRILIIGGKTALECSLDKLKKNISSDFEIVDTVIFGNECYEERVNELYSQFKEKNISFIVGVGGGKALDTSKFLSLKLDLPIVTIPTIASTCAASSCLSVIYTKDHAFEKFVYYKKPPYHIFIDTKIITDAPFKYLRAGIGDTLAKHYEIEFSARGKDLDYSSALGLTISNMCCDPLFKYGVDALNSAKKNVLNNSLEQVILAIIITTGIVSQLINPDYNGAIAHALFYGLTNIKGFEEKFLHGDVVGYATIVQLMVDKNIDEAKKIKSFLDSLDIETTLKQRNIPCTKEYLQNVLTSAINDPDMKVIAYPVNVDMLYDAILAVENL